MDGLGLEVLRVEAGPLIAQVADKKSCRECFPACHKGEDVEEEGLLGGSTGEMASGVGLDEHLAVSVGVLGASKQPAGLFVGGTALPFVCYDLGCTLFSNLFDVVYSCPGRPVAGLPRCCDTIKLREHPKDPLTKSVCESDGWPG